MINLRLGRWLAFTILVLVFLSTLAPAQETSPHTDVQAARPANPPPEHPRSRHVP